jgi:hypothetical protein
MIRSAAARRVRWIGAAVGFAVAFAIGLAVVRPFTVGPIGPDAAAPVIEFQRLVAGERLEGYLSQTSKPLLTVVYGVARVATGDWRVVSLVAIGSFALFVALATVLAHRIGGLAAAGFVAVGLALSPPLLRDVTFAYGISWAGLATVVAGLAVLAPRPRYAVAGTALALGALARPEVLAVTAFAMAAVLAGQLAARTGRTSGPPRSAWLLGIGLAAIPILCVHDWALTGDPLFWATTAQANSVGLPTLSLGRMIRFVWTHVLTLGPLLPLAAVGVVDLVARRRWGAAVVVSIVPVAVAAFFIASGARGTVISLRYLVPVDLGIVFAAGIGLGLLGIRLYSWLPPRFRSPITTSPARRLLLVVPVLAGALAAVVIAPFWPGDSHAQEALAAQRAKEENAARAFDVLRTVMGPVPPWQGQPPATSAGTVVLIPQRLRAQGIVDLGLPLWAGTKLIPELVRPEDGLPEPGTIVYHDSRDDSPDPAWSAIEVSEPTVVGKRLFVPLYVDAANGIWIVRVDDAPSGIIHADAAHIPPAGRLRELARVTAPSRSGRKVRATPDAQASAPDAQEKPCSSDSSATAAATRPSRTASRQAST